MQAKEIALSFNSELLDNAETILEDIGLDVQSAVNMFLRRIVKEGGIGFLLQPTEPLSLAKGKKSVEEENKQMEDELEERTKSVGKYKSGLGKTKSKITEEMRDYIWRVFLQNKKSNYTRYGELAQEVAESTGMNANSAYIYFCILSCLIKGKFNSRDMKFIDLEFYMERISQECTTQELANAIKSLEQSVLYWEDMPGRFSDKVKKLIREYK